MNNRRPGSGSGSNRSRPPKQHGKRRNSDPGSGAHRPLKPPAQVTRTEVAGFVDRLPVAKAYRETEQISRERQGAFRVLIAVHRPRYRGRVERAAAIPGWEVTSLLNKQDPVGQVERGEHPPDITILSSDFGRQKSFGIFRAIQARRKAGMKVIGMVESCEPDDDGNIPQDLCDICIPPPYKTADIRELLCRQYELIRGKCVPLTAVIDIDDTNYEE